MFPSCKNEMHDDGNFFQKNTGKCGERKNPTI